MAPRRDYELEAAGLGAVGRQHRLAAGGAVHLRQAFSNAAVARAEERPWAEEVGPRLRVVVGAGLRAEGHQEAAEAPR